MRSDRETYLTWISIAGLGMVGWPGIREDLGVKTLKRGNVRCWLTLPPPLEIGMGVVS